MARPIDFPESNVVWKGYPAEGNRPEVEDLPVLREGNHSVSCWELTEEERAVVAETGLMYAIVLTAKHPPIALTPIKPFAKPEDVDAEVGE